LFVTRKNQVDKVFKPNKWIAGILGLIFQWLAFLYVVRLKWAIFYFLAAIILGVAQMVIVFRWPDLWLIAAILNISLPIICAAHAFRVAVVAKEIIYRPWYSRWYGMVLALCLMFTCIFGFRIFFCEPFRIPSGSMLPTLKIGSFVVVEKNGFGTYGTFGITLLNTTPSKTLYRGDVIVFKYPKDETLDYIQRIIGLPGDKIEYVDKKLFINDEQVNTRLILEVDYVRIIEEKIDDKIFQIQNHVLRRAQDLNLIVPEDHYFVMGDNRDDSRDSRIWGFLPEENIVGRLVYVIDPPVIE
jgi:signal peptidase I